MLLKEHLAELVIDALLLHLLGKSALFIEQHQHCGPYEEVRDGKPNEAVVAIELEEGVALVEAVHKQRRDGIPKHCVQHLNQNQEGYPHHPENVEESESLAFLPQVL